MTKQINLFEYNGLHKESGLQEISKIKIKNYNLGLVYQGAKRRIAYDILSYINAKYPKVDIIYDIFGGGGSITLNALKCGYNVVYNEIGDVYYIFEYLKNPKPSKFGILPEEFYNYLEREEFHSLKDAKPSLYKAIMQIVYSFGGAGVNYFSAEKKEIFKRNGHNIVIFQDKKGADFFDDYFKCHLFNEFIKLDFKNWVERRKVFVNVMLKIEALSVTNLLHTSPFKTIRDFIENSTRSFEIYVRDNMPKDTPLKKYKKDNNHNRLYELKQLQQLERLERLQQLERLERLERLEQLEQLQRLEQLEQLQQLQRLEQLEFFNVDYRDLKIPLQENILIYCDPPYLNTTQYKTPFNHSGFYEWVLSMHRKGHNILISEYSMPSDFVEVWRKNVKALMSSKSATLGLEATEKLFKPKG